MKTPKDCTSIKEVRNEIDRIDHSIIELLSERYGFVKEIVRFKTTPDDVVAQNRYDEVLKVRRAWAQEKGLNGDLIEKIYTDLINHFIDVQMKLMDIK